MENVHTSETFSIDQKEWRFIQRFALFLFLSLFLTDVGKSYTNRADLCDLKEQGVSI